MAEISKNTLVIHGMGMIASSIRCSMEDIDAAIFAAGVSNSGYVDAGEYRREIEELKTFIENNINRKIVYFSSYIAEDGVSRYAEHKREIESIIAAMAEDFLILRLPQVVGPATNRTLVRYIVECAKLDRVLTIQRDAVRSLLDVCDIARVLSVFDKKKLTREVIAVGPLTPLRVIDIVKEIEEILRLNISMRLVNGGDEQMADVSRALSLLGREDTIFSSSYQSWVLKRYVPCLFREIS